MKIIAGAHDFAIVNKTFENDEKKEKNFLHFSSKFFNFHKKFSNFFDFPSNSFHQP